MIVQLILMTETEARLLVDEIKSGISEIGQKLLELYEREGWKALHYSSWRECVMTEFNFQHSRVYQLLDLARVQRELSTNGGNVPLPINERQIRPLTHLEPDQQREVWREAVETAPNGKPTAAHVQGIVDAFNYKRDSKINREGDIYTPQGYDACQTPAYAIDPLLPYLRDDWQIWEPAAGEGNLTEALYDAGFPVADSDILTGHNFFEYEPPAWDCLITNPPYSIKYDWLKRCYELGKPFALLVPVEMIGAQAAQALFKQYGVELMLLNRRVNFKMPNKGWGGAGAQFPVLWLCWQILPKEINYGEIVNSDELAG